jgi:MacB-like periplasmic core domain
MLCVASGALGYVIAALTIRQFSEISVTFPMVGAVSFGLNLHLDFTVAAFTLGLMVVAIAGTGLAPALYASAPSLAQVLSGELVVGGTGKAVRRNILVIVQVAMCTLVLVGMGLCERSLYNLRHVDPGFSARNLIAMAVYPNGQTIPEAKGRALAADLRRQVSALPGVEAVTLTSELPLLGASPEAVLFPGATKTTEVAHAVVDADYFDTFRIRVLSGRVFNSFDRQNAPEVVIVNHKLAETLWPARTRWVSRSRWARNLARRSSSAWSPTASMRIWTKRRGRSSTMRLASIICLRSTWWRGRTAIRSCGWFRRRRRCAASMWWC